MMTRHDYLQCHIFLRALTIPYDPTTTHSPTLRIIQLSELFNVSYFPPDDFHLERLRELPRFQLICVDLPQNECPESAAKFHWLNFHQSLDRFLLGYTDEQFRYIIQHSNPGSFWRNFDPSAHREIYTGMGNSF